jgi:hypothetical protein
MSDGHPDSACPRSIFDLSLKLRIALPLLCQQAASYRSSLAHEQLVLWHAAGDPVGITPLVSGRSDRHA